MPGKRVDPKRIHELTGASPGSGPVILWMSRDCRMRDNWALLHAQDIAIASGAPLAAAFCLAPSFLGAGRRQYDFMLDGLRQLEGELGERGIAFLLLAGEPSERIPELVERTGAGMLVADFDPLRIKQDWQRDVAGRLGNTAFHEVDTHNIVPCRVVSGKQEYAARTIRPKIHWLLDSWMSAVPGPTDHPHRWPEKVVNDWESAGGSIEAGEPERPVPGREAGERAALAALDDFVCNRLHRYHLESNDPAAGCTSGLSPWLHFGQLSAQRVANETLNSTVPIEAKQAFLEQLVVRRELSDNFCLYNPRYDSVEGFPDWARRTLDEHRDDPREHVYSFEELESARTHDPLWNAAQREMVLTGYMHGYMRMYWAKKILEWSESPEEALENGIGLNDKWQLDGRDPNGYTGLAWSIGGVHDRPWQERPVYGKVRYMSAAGCRRKFDMDAYLERIELLEDGAGS